MENSFLLKSSSVKGNSDALIQFKLKSDLSDSKCILFSPTLEKLIFFPEENFLTISYIIEEEVVVLPSSNTSTFDIWWIKIKSKSVAVIVSFEEDASNSTLDNIGKVLLFSITPWQ